MSVHLRLWFFVALSLPGFVGSSNRNQTCIVRYGIDRHNGLEDIPDAVFPILMVTSVTNSLPIIPSVVLNSLTIWTILSKRNLRSSNFNLLLAMLASSDFFTALVFQPLYSAIVVCSVQDCRVPCPIYDLYYIGQFISITLTFFTLTLAGIERYIAIEYPMHQPNITKCKLIFAAFVYLAVPIIVISNGVAAAQGEKRQRVVVFAFFVTNVAITLFCNSKIQITAFRHKRAIKSQVQALQQQGQLSDLNIRLREYKSAMAMSLMVLGSFVCYCPAIVGMSIYLTQGNVTGTLHYVIKPICSVFIYSQSLLNPVMMCIRLRYIRKGVLDKLLCRRPRVEQGNS